MPKRIWEFVNEFLRINAIRRMLAIVDVRSSEVGGLVGFAVLFAIFEGIGLALLLPILQYADGGQTAIFESSGILWRTIATVMESLHLPVTLPILLLLAFIPILLRQVVFYFNAWYSAVVSTRIGMRLRMQTLDTILDADPEFFSRHPVGYLVGVVIAQTGVGGTAILAIIKQLSIALLMLVYVVILLAISVPLTLTAVSAPKLRMVQPAISLWLPPRMSIAASREPSKVSPHTRTCSVSCSTSIGFCSSGKMMSACFTGQGGQKYKSCVLRSRYHSPGESSSSSTLRK